MCIPIMALVFFVSCNSILGSDAGKRKLSQSYETDCAAPDMFYVPGESLMRSLLPQKKLKKEKKGQSAAAALISLHRPTQDSNGGCSVRHVSQVPQFDINTASDLRARNLIFCRYNGSCVEFQEMEGDPDAISCLKQLAKGTLIMDLDELRDRVMQHYVASFKDDTDFVKKLVGAQSQLRVGSKLVAVGGVRPGYHVFFPEDAISDYGRVIKQRIPKEKLDWDRYCTLLRDCAAKLSTDCSKAFLTLKPEEALELQQTMREAMQEKATFWQVVD